MWEFTPDDDGGEASSDLGYSYSIPTIAMTNDEDVDGQQRWAAIFGNGYNATNTVTGEGQSALYIVFLEGGLDDVWTDTDDFIKIKTGNGISASNTTPNGLGTPRLIDHDGDGDVDYVYAGDLHGKLYRFDLTSTTSSDWEPAGATEIFAAEDSSGNSQSITTQPLVFNHPTETGEYIVVTATGKWIEDSDATDTSIQSLYGVWDNLSSSVTRSQLTEQVLTNEASAFYGFSVRTLTNNTFTWKDTGSASNQKRGWYIDFDVLSSGSIEYPGERGIQVQTRADILFVNTILPKDANTCQGVQGGFQMAIDPYTGGRTSVAIFDVNSDGAFDSADNVGSVDTGVVAALKFDAAPAPSSFIGTRRVTQLSDTSIVSIDTNTNDGASTSTRRTSWREITDD